MIRNIILMMKNLHFKDSFKNFLYDLNFFITMYDNHCHVFNYHKLNKLSDIEIDLIINDKLVKIIGNNLSIKQMTKQELLINGNILKVEFENE